MGARSEIENHAAKDREPGEPIDSRRVGDVQLPVHPDSHTEADELRVGR